MHNFSGSFDGIYNEISNSGACAYVMGNSNSGKTSLSLKLANHFWQSKSKRVCLVSANRHLVDLAKKKFIESLLASTESQSVDNLSLKGLSFLTMSALAYHFINNNTTNIDSNSSEAIDLLSGGEDEIMLKKAVDNALGEFIKDNRFTKYHEMLKTKSVINHLRDIIAVCIQFQINYAKLNEITDNEKKDVLNELNVDIWYLVAFILKNYQSLLESNKKFDSNTLFDAAIKCVNNTDKMPYDVIIVDDAQELNKISSALVEEFAKKGVQIILIGNPNQCANFFRGAIGKFSNGVMKVLLGSDVKYYEFEGYQNYINLPQKITNLIRNDQRIIMDSQHSVWKYIIQTIRHEHIFNSIDYQDFAIIARNQDILYQINKELSIRNIPCDYQANPIPLKNEPIYLELKSYIQNDQNYQLDLNTVKAADYIWKAWIGINKAEQLQNNVLRQIETNHSNHILDTVMQILEMTKEHNTIDDFFDYVERQEVYADNIFAKKDNQSVSLLTPATALGRHFKQVFVIEVNESVWPNMRLRGQTFKTRILFDLCAKKLNSCAQYREIDARSEIRSTELSLFEIATTRSENTLVFAVKDDNSIPSEFLDNGEEFPLNELEYECSSLEDMAVDIRQKLVEDEINSRLDGDVSKSLYQELRFLDKITAQNVNPKNWYYANLISSHPLSESIADNSRRILLGPSSLESLLKCPLNWFYSKNASSQIVTQSANIGTIVHKCLEEFSYAKEDVVFKLVGDLKGSASEVVDDLDSTFIKIKEYYQQIRSDYGYDELDDLNKHLTDTKVLCLLKRAIGYYANQNSQNRSVATIQNKIGLEFKGSYKLGEITIDNEKFEVILSGSIDRIEQKYEYQNGKKVFLPEYHIIDWKTGKNVWKAKSEADKDLQNVEIYEMFNLQLFCYSLMLKAALEADGDEVKVDSSLIFLGKEPNFVSNNSDQNEYKKVRPAIGNDNFYNKWFNQEEEMLIKDTVLQSLQKIFNANYFKANAVDSKCRSCDFKSSCNTQQIGKRIGE